MDIREMHTWFRQYAQQMGMQNVRAILPEQIDLVINTSIIDTTNEIIKSSVGVTNDRIVTDNSKLPQVNALRGLYKVITVAAEVLNPPTIGNPFQNGEETTVRRIYSELEKLTNDGYKPNFDYMYLVDFAINYKYVHVGQSSDNAITNYFPIRLIDDAYLADTINDFILKPRVRTPVAVVYNDQIDIYIDDLINGKLPNGLIPNKLRVSYIAKPAVVKYVSDLGGNNVDCDLPEYLHVDILKHAVDLFNISVRGGLYNQQQSQQNQQQEIARNEARPVNEGYAS